MNVFDFYIVEKFLVIVQMTRYIQVHKLVIKANFGPLKLLWFFCDYNYHCYSAKCKTFFVEIVIVITIII